MYKFKIKIHFSYSTVFQFIIILNALFMDMIVLVNARSAQSNTGLEVRIPQKS